jgi:hypothetical protein
MTIGLLDQKRTMSLQKESNRFEQKQKNGF